MGGTLLTRSTMRLHALPVTDICLTAVNRWLRQCSVLLIKMLYCEIGFAVVKLRRGAVGGHTGSEKQLAYARMYFTSETPLICCRERELFQAMTDNEVAQGMLANVKISMPGMQKAVQGQKKAKKQKGR